MKKLILLVSLFTSFSAIAGTTVSGKITKVWAQASGSYDTFAVTLDVTPINPESCPHQGWYRLNASNAGYKTAVSMLLSAYATGKTVDLYLDGCDSYPRYTNVTY